MLTQVAQGVLAWLAETPGPGHPNAGAVIDADGITLVDTLVVPSQAAQLAAELEALGHPVRRVVLTSSHIEHTGGTVQFRLAAMFGTPQISVRLDQPPNAPAYQRLFPEHAAELAEPVTRPVSHVVRQPAYLSQAVVAVPATGQITENLVVQVPGCGVVFGGAMCSFDSRPLAFDGDPLRWADELDSIVELGGVIVPGHGPVGGVEQIREQQAYLRACAACDGDVAAMPSGPWDAWPGREYDEINVERAALLAQGDDRPPPSMLRLLGLE